MCTGSKIRGVSSVLRHQDHTLPWTNKIDVIFEAISV